MVPTSDDARHVGAGEAASTKRRPGGRSARVRAAVLDAALAALFEEGDAFSIPRVAARAGVHETSIYRRWGSPEALIVDALASRIGEEIPVPDTGSLRGDLVAFLERSVAFLTSPLGALFLRAATIAPRAATTDLRQTYWPRRFEQVGAIFERAVSRGEVAPTADLALATELLAAPLYLRLLVTHAPLDDALPARLADFVLRGVMDRGTGAP